MVFAAEGWDGVARPGSVDQSGDVETTPNYEAIEQAEAVAVRVALERGFLTVDQLREALLLREQLRVAGRQTRLLQLLGARFIHLEHQAVLSQVYFAFLNDQVDPPAPAESVEPPASASSEVPQDMLFSSADELAIPELMLQRSSEQLERPPAEDPEPVQEFMEKNRKLNPSAQQDGDEDVSESGLWRWLKDHLPGS